MAEVYDQEDPRTWPGYAERTEAVISKFEAMVRDFEGMMNEPKKPEPRWRKGLARLAARPFLRRIERG